MEHPGDDTLEMFRAITRLRRAWHPIRPSVEISKSLFATLMTIAHAGDKGSPGYAPIKIVNGGIAVSDLAMLINQSLPVMSQRVRALEKLSHVERFSDDEDRRISRVRLTKSGKLEVEKAHIAMKKHMDKVIEIFGCENITTLISVLDKLTDAFEQAAVPSEQILKEKNI